MAINMKTLNQMQNRIAKIQKELDETTVDGSAGGGVVTAQVNGARKLLAIKIDPSAVDPEDVELLEDLVLTAVQDAMDKAEALAGEKMGALTGGMGIPGF
ncbi:MAG: YbaB/EbfC family nucleoid-associated protein [Chloroflexota bacterium]|nr:YbaB/EbfC family nucleoid-associated protein [Chloroflexota bacterium]